MHSLFGFVTELIIVKHRDSPACFSGWWGFLYLWGCCLVACGCAGLLGLSGAGGGLMCVLSVWW